MRFLSELRERLAALFFRTREERELEEELAFHFDSAVAENMRRGMNRAEARRRAALTLGGMERIKEEVRDERGTRLFEDLVRDFRFAFRRLLKEPGFTLPTIATIALGIGVTTAVFAMVRAILLQPLPYPNADRLVQIQHVAPRADLSVTGLSPGLFLHYRDRNRSFDAMAVYMEHASTLTDGDNPEQVRVALVSSDLFSVLGINPHRGILPTPPSSASDNGAGVLVSHDLWVRRFGGNPNIVGRLIEIDRQPELITGVAPPHFDFPRADTDLWMTGRIEELLTRFGGRASISGLYLNGIARLQDGVRAETAGRDLDRLIAVLPEVFPDVTRDDLERMALRAKITPLKAVVVGDVRAALLLLAATAAFLLLITWANATNLSLLRAERQRREIAVERALGATHRRIIQRFVSEGVVLTAVGGMLGFVLALAAVTARFGFEVEDIPRLGEVGIDGVVAAFGIGLCLLTVMLFALVSFTSVRTSTFGGNRVTAGPGSQAVRKVLVVGQVALALTLLIGSALMVRSYRHLALFDIGFRTDRTLTFFLPLPADPYSDSDATVRLHQEVLTQLRALSGVETVETATTAAFPLTPVPDHYNDRITVAGRVLSDTALAPRALFSFATPGYFRAMGIPILQGRTFEQSQAGLSEVVLSAALARGLFANADPIGKRVRSMQTGGGEYVVVGVVGNVPSRSIRDGASNVLYFANLNTFQTDSITAVGPGVALRDEQYVVRASQSPTVLVPAIRERINDVDAKLLMSRVGPLGQLVTESMARERLTMVLLIVGATTALSLGLIGIYGILSYTVRQRNKELGIRFALGATPGGVVRMVVWHGAVLALAGIAVGLLAAFGLTRYVDGLLYQVTPTDPIAFVSMAVFLLGVSLVASYIPAHRAARVDPMRALRTD